MGWKVHDHKAAPSSFIETDTEAEDEDYDKYVKNFKRILEERKEARLAMGWKVHDHKAAPSSLMEMEEGMGMNSAAQQQERQQQAAMRQATWGHIKQDDNAIQASLQALQQHIKAEKDHDTRFAAEISISGVHNMRTA